MHLRTKFLTRAVVVGLLLGWLPVATGTSAEAAQYCGLHWGSLAKGDDQLGPSRRPPFGLGPVTNIRSGQHACFDRLVLDIEGTTRPAYSVAYVGRSHGNVALRGGARLFVNVRAGIWTPRECLHGMWLLGRPPEETNRREVVNASGYRTFRQVAMYGETMKADSNLLGCSQVPGPFPLQVTDGTTGVGIGLRARLPFRAFTLPGGPAGGSRIVIDVAHRW